MAITPKEIQEKEFHITRRGYSPKEVDEFLDYLVEEVDKLIKENESLRQRAAQTFSPETERLKKALQDALVTAQLAADEIKTRAQQEAQRIIEEARKRAEENNRRLLEEIRELEGRVKRLKDLQDEISSSLRSMLSSFMSKLESIEASNAVSLGSSLTSEFSDESFDSSSSASESAQVEDQLKEEASEPSAASEALEPVDSADKEEKKETEDAKDISLDLRVGRTPRRKRRIEIADDELADKFFGLE